MADSGDRDPSRRPRFWSPREAVDEPVEFDPQGLAGLFAAPPWLRDFGNSAWLAVGGGLLVVGIVTLLELTSTIVMPVVTAGIIASVTAPIVDWLKRHKVPRGIGSALVLVAMIVIAIGIIVAVVGGITSQLAGLKGEFADAKDQIAKWLTDLGIDSGSAHTATKDGSAAVSTAVAALLNGIKGGLKTLSSLAVFLSFTGLSLFFLLKDARTIRSWTENHMRVSPQVAHQMMGRVLQSLRGYFVGVTLVALFNVVVVTLGALILGVPNKGAIALITFLGAYVPYIGAWTAGAFSVLVALGGAGTEAAIGMAIVQLLANGVLQQMIQPLAMGAALGIHPLAVLIVTIAGGALFGAVGLILAAPVTSAATRIATDLAHSRAGPAEPEPAPAAAGAT